ncbi:MAG: zinc-ribbon domain-containing protein [Clostridia bacterium]|nr:zinc-ribbon domain-containing protein [Clostridia bacterium]
MKTLAEYRPDLLEEWDYSLNGDLSPYTVSYGSAVAVHWICGRCGNNFVMTVNHRTNRNSGCPVCAREKRGQAKTASSAKKNSFQESYPEIAKEWHPSNNGTLTPADVSVRSNKKVFWLCPVCGFEYAATVNHRTLGKTGCPKCAGQVKGKALSLNAAENNNFAVNFPLLAAEWDADANGDLKPEDVSSNSNYIVGWICSFCGYKWKKSIIKRTHGYGCPNCTKAGTSFSELALLFYLRKAFPDVLHRQKIEDLEFDLFIPCIKTAIEYDGVYYHNSDRARIKENAKDVFCKTNGITLFRIRDPKLPDTESAVRISCIDKQQKHLTDAIRELLDRLCPEKEIEVDLVKDAPSIISDYRNSVKEHSIAVLFRELLAFWHPTKNLPLTPEQVTIGKKIKLWWVCPVCGYDYLQDINHKVHGQGCPVCAGKKVVEGYNDLATTHPLIAAQFHKTKNGDLTAAQITAGSKKMIWWLCDVCGYEWQMAPYTRKAGVGCPCCAGKAVKVGFNDLASQYPQLAKEWDYEANGDLRPESFTKGSSQRINWICSQGHKWNAVIYSRTAGTGCPVCGRLTGAAKRKKSC